MPIEPDHNDPAKAAQPGGSHMKSPLGRIAGPVPANAEEIDALRRRVWQERGFLVIDAADGRLDPAQRAFVESMGEWMFGRRSKGGTQGTSRPGPASAKDRSA